MHLSPKQIEKAKQEPRETLEGALRSVDNLTTLLTQLCDEKSKQAVAVNTFVGNGRISIFVTADNNIDEVKMGLAIANALKETTEGILSQALHARSLEVGVLREVLGKLVPFLDEPNRSWVVDVLARDVATVDGAP